MSSLSSFDETSSAEEFSNEEFDFNNNDEFASDHREDFAFDHREDFAFDHREDFASEEEKPFASIFGLMWSLLVCVGMEYNNVSIEFSYYIIIYNIIQYITKSMMIYEDGEEDDPLSTQQFLLTEQRRRFSSASLKTTPQLSLDGLQTLARVLDVYDGDTMTVALEFHGSLCKIRVRLQGIDAPEMKISCDKKEEEKYRAIASRNRLIQFVIGNKQQGGEGVGGVGGGGHWSLRTTRRQVQDYFSRHIVLVKLSCSHFDKYGRTLAHVRCDVDRDDIDGGITASDVLLTEGLAEVYNTVSK
jgi:endonuclease YncB( thermonuclease family)